MSDHDPIDRLLDEAFRSRPVPLDSHPSMMDVRRRARRRHHRRTGATLGAVALVGVGGAVALAVRHDGRDQLAAGEGDLGTPTTITCDGALDVATTVPAATLPVNTVPPFDPSGTTTTMPPNGAPPTTTYGWSPYDPCAPGGWTWHCTGPMGTDEFGRDVFESCEQVNDGSFSTTTITILLPSSTILEPEVTTSVNGNTDQTTTTSTIAIFDSTTTSLGG